MPIEFRVLESAFSPERGELLVVGRLDDGILVTGMLAAAGGRKATVQEIEMLLEGERGTVFRLTFACPDPEEAPAWVEAWKPDATLSLLY